MKRENTGGLDIYQIKGETLEARIEAVRKLVTNPPQQKIYAREWEPFSPEPPPILF